MSSLTIDDLAGHINLPGGVAYPAPDPRRAELQRALDTAVQGVTRMTGWLDATTATALVSAGWERLLPLPYMRLTSIGTITDPSGLVVLPYRVDPFAGLVELSAGTPGTWSVVCTCTTPWSAELQTAALDWAAHVYDTQRTTLNPSSSDDQPLPSFALPNRVDEFVRPYRVPGIA